MAEKTKPIIDLNDKLLEIVVQNNFDTSIDIGGILWILILIGIGGLLLIRALFLWRNQTLEIDEAEFGIGNQKIRLKPNSTDSQIAYQIWVELSTRKIGIPIELEKDVIVEVYDSWYQFFKVTRELLKGIPVSKIWRKETRSIIKLSINVLNYGVRPHLTMWQAKFRRWYEKEIDDQSKLDLTPQEIQKEYPEYKGLVEDLIRVNKKLINYRKSMYMLAVGNNNELEEG
ncbi:MAG: hypothetical protein ABW176_15485 [Candidatus Thiodiazotropha endolucinida]